MAISVLIVDDHYMVVEGIHSLLQNEEQIEWVGHANNAASCLALLQSRVPDVLLMDISLPDASGIDLCKQVKQLYPAVFVLALTTFSQLNYVDQMMAAGASGYLLKNVSARELTEALQKVVSGKIVFSDEVAKAMHVQAANRGVVITRREKEVLALIANGQTNQEIATMLYVSVSTVETHRKNLLQKLQAKNTAALVKLAMDQKLI